MRRLVLVLVTGTAASALIGFTGAAGSASGIVEFIFWQCLVLLGLGLAAHVSASFEQKARAKARRDPPSGDPLSPR